MTPFSPEASQAFLDAELTVLAWLFQSVPFGSLMLLAAVVFAVGWLSWTEVRQWEARRRHM